MWQVFPDTSLALANYPPFETRHDSVDPVEEAKGNMRRLFALLRDHDAFAQTTLAALVNRWGVIKPPESNLFPHPWLLNLCDHLNFPKWGEECRSRDFEESLADYLASAQSQLSFTEWIFRYLPRKRVIWIRRGADISDIRWRYVWKDYIVQIDLPRESYEPRGMTEYDEGAIEFRDEVRFVTLAHGSPRDGAGRDGATIRRDDPEITRLVCELEIGGSNHDSDKRVAEIANLLHLHNVIRYWTDIVYIPSSGNRNKYGVCEGSGGLILFERLPNNSPDATNRWFRDTLERVKYIHSVVQQFYSFYIRQDRERISQYYAARSAIAAIMGRVHAHDLGHVLSNAQLPEDEPEHAKAYFRYLTDYLRTRMVFAAEASSADPGWAMTVPLMSQVLMPFVSCFEPTKNVWHQSPVCSHIAQSENVTEVKLKILYDGCPLEYKQDPSDQIWRCDPSEVFITIPTGLVGIHALYCILENVIRNGAKYGDKGNKRLKLSIALNTTEHDDLVRVRVWDDHSTGVDAYEKVSRYFPPVSLGNNANNADRGEDEAWRIVDDSGGLVDGGFGIKEMRISAAWLRGRSTVSSLMRPESLQPPLMRPLVVDDSGEEVVNTTGPGPTRYLGYEFFLLKPKELLLLDPDLELGEDEERARCRGIEVHHDLSSDKEYRHQMCLVRLPSDPNESKRWLDTMVARRDAMPNILGVVLPDGSDMSTKEVPRSVQVQEDMYFQIQQELFEEQGVPYSALRVMREWTQVVLGGHGSLKLLLQLRADAEQPAPAGIAAAWQRTAERFNSIVDGWSIQPLCVASEKAPLPDRQVMAYDYHSVLGTGDGFGFHEPCFKTEASQIVLFNPPEDEWVRLCLAMGLVQSAIATVAIVDERVWAQASENLPEQFVSLREALAHRRIFIPDQSVVNYDVPRQTSPEGLIGWLEDRNARILVIHQGMLDKMFDTREDIEAFVTSVKRIAPLVIVESDRGEALLSRRPRNARFLPFSAIQPWISLRGPSKYQLVQSILCSWSGGEHAAEAGDPAY